MPDSREQIMEATFRALCEHGYADLSIQRIADRCDRGKSLIYYHYDDKQDLMLSFLDHLADRIEEDQRSEPDRSTGERLDTYLDRLFGREEQDWRFQTALQELRIAGQSDAAIAERFREIDAMMIHDLAGLLDAHGTRDPEETARLVFAVAEGDMVHRASHQQPDQETGLHQQAADLIRDRTDT